MTDQDFQEIQASCPNHCCWEGQAFCEQTPCPLDGKEVGNGICEVIWDSRLPRECELHKRETSLQ